MCTLWLTACTQQVCAKLQVLALNYLGFRNHKNYRVIVSVSSSASLVLISLSKVLPDYNGKFRAQLATASLLFSFDLYFRSVFYVISIDLMASILRAGAGYAFIIKAWFKHFFFFFFFSLVLSGSGLESVSAWSDRFKQTNKQTNKHRNKQTKKCL